MLVLPHSYTSPSSRAPPHSDNEPVPTLPSPPSIQILCRSYAGDRTRLLANLCPTANLFLDRTRFPLTVVLDDEAPDDHALGAMLLNEGRVDRVIYEPLPPDWQRFFRGLAFPPPYDRPGYDRQQWSTFYMDRYTDADILAVVDSDATFMTYVTPENLVEPDGRIRLHVLQPPLRMKLPFRFTTRGLGHLKSIDGSVYGNDPVALREPAPYEGMWTDRMPMCFWRSTLANLRRHVAEQWGVPFDEAFREFATGPFSQFNILINYALSHEPDRYVAVLQTEPGRDLVSVCENRCWRREDIVIGGIRSYGLGRHDLGPFGLVALLAARRDTRHLNRFSAKLGNPCRRAHVERHYENVRRAVAALPAEVRDAKVAALVAFMRHGVQRVVSLNRMPRWLRVAGWDRSLSGAGGR